MRLQVVNVLSINACLPTLGFCIDFIMSPISPNTDPEAVDSKMAQSPEISKSEKIATELSSMSIVEGKVLDEDTADIINAETEYTDEYYKKLLRRIDLFLLPVMWVSKHIILEHISMSYYVLKLT